MQIKIALCHLDVSMGPKEANLQKLELAVAEAGRLSANWVITPETALQGYFFYKNNPFTRIASQPETGCNNLIKLVQKYKLHLFLGAADYIPEKQASYNTCLVFNPEGKILHRHCKNITHKFGAEAWLEEGTEVKMVEINGVKVGCLVCADAWSAKNYMCFKEQGAELLIDIAAWPKTKVCGDPRDHWERCSRESGLPMVLCNQTGNNPWMDMLIGESVCLLKGEIIMSYHGEEALLVCTYDTVTGTFTDDKFTIIPI